MRYHLFLFFVLTSCVTNPVTRKSEFGFVSENQERQIGKESFQPLIQAEGGLFIADPAVQAYVAHVGRKLADVSARPNLPYEFVVLNAPVPNAWTLPGGKIAIYRGLLLKLENEAELAAVLAHEIVHANARHGAKGMERSIILQTGIMALGSILNDSQYNDILVGTAGYGANLIHMKYSRGFEFEADHFGMHYMQKAGYDPQAAVTLQKMFLTLSKDPHWLAGLFASHPPTQERVEENKKTLASFAHGGFLGQDEYKTALKTLFSAQGAYTLYEEGLNDAHKKKWKQAKIKAEEAIRLFPNEAHFYALQGISQYHLGNIQDAKEHLSDAIALNPDYYAFYLQRAAVFLALQDKKSAKKDLQKSVSLLPTGEAHELLGELALQSQRKKEAIYHFQIASHANSPAGMKARYFLQELSR